VKCLGCNTHQTVALDIVRRPKATPVHELERYMRCKDCSQVRGYPYKRSHLMALRTTKISARWVVVIVRERDGNSVPTVFNSESQAASFIRARIAKGTVVHADEAAAWDNLHERFEVKRINHQEAYSQDGACTNWAEEYFSRLRRAEIGIHHHIAGSYFLRYAQESSWEDDRTMAIE
jgi:hypothetical protein